MTRCGTADRPRWARSVTSDTSVSIEQTTVPPRLSMLWAAPLALGVPHMGSDENWWEPSSCSRHADADEAFSCYLSCFLRAAQPDIYQMLTYCTALRLAEGHLVYAHGEAPASSSPPLTCDSNPARCWPSSDGRRTGSPVVRPASTNPKASLAPRSQAGRSIGIRTTASLAATPSRSDDPRDHRPREAVTITGLGPVAAAVRCPP